MGSFAPWFKPARVFSVLRFQLPKVYRQFLRVQLLEIRRGPKARKCCFPLSVFLNLKTVAFNPHQSGDDQGILTATMIEGAAWASAENPQLKALEYSGCQISRCRGVSGSHRSRHFPCDDGKAQAGCNFMDSVNEAAAAGITSNNSADHAGVSW